MGAGRGAEAGFGEMRSGPWATGCVSRALLREPFFPGRFLYKVRNGTVL